MLLNTYTEEYAHLQQVRRDYPTYQVVLRHIRTNSSKNTYRGLTYEYMESYIMTHGTEETRMTNFKRLQDMRLISQCHSNAFRYDMDGKRVRNPVSDDDPELLQYQARHDEM